MNGTMIGILVVVVVVLIFALWSATHDRPVEIDAQEEKTIETEARHNRLHEPSPREVAAHEREVAEEAKDFSNYSTGEGLE